MQEISKPNIERGTKEYEDYRARKVAEFLGEKNKMPVVLSDRPYTYADIAKEIQDDTPFGQSFLESAFRVDADIERIRAERAARNPLTQLRKRLKEIFSKDSNN
jgi:hypothetical protein